MEVRRGSLPGWVRLAAIPAVVVLFLLGVWVTGGLLTNDFRAAMGLTGLWFGLAALLAFLVARRWRELRVPVGATFLVTAAVVGGFLMLSTLRDTTVNENVVTGRMASAAGGGASENVTIAQGPFMSIGHETSGTASVVELPDGTRKLTLTSFQTDAGPDLFVYLVAGGDPENVGDHQSLGSLKGNKGNQQYDVRPTIDLAKYDTVVIWCRAFSVAFGAADLAPT
jgi:hypothetical protein